MPKVSREYLDGRRTQILAAAERCFSRQGFHRATMQDVVAESGLSPGAIYRYFRGKGAIVSALAADRHARERAVLARAIGRGHVVASLRELLHGFLGALADPAERSRRRLGVQLWAEALRDPAILETVRQGLHGPRRAIAGALAQAQKRGELAPRLDPDAMARLCIAVFHGLVLQQAWDDREDVGACVGALEALLTGGLRLAPGPAHRRTAPRRAP
jgi:AcrR family transcriptional regulator